MDARLPGLFKVKIRSFLVRPAAEATLNYFVFLFSGRFDFFNTMRLRRTPLRDKHSIIRSFGTFEFALIREIRVKVFFALNPVRVFGIFRGCSSLDFQARLD